MLLSQAFSGNRSLIEAILSLLCNHAWLTTTPSPRLKGGSQAKPADIASYYQLTLGVERIRAPEVLFQPSVGGHRLEYVEHSASNIYLRTPL